MTAVPAPIDLTPVPPGHVLLHIGPHKTGSTALQSALFTRREELASYGVVYPGRWRRLVRQGRALMDWAPRGQEVPPISVWDDFAAEVRAIADRGEQRVCLSSEDFGRLRDSGKCAKLVADLGADRLHVVAVARAYHRVLPSHWQERIKAFLTLPFEEWVREMLEGDPEDHNVRSFWTYHDSRWMTSVWLEHLPPDRFTLIVSDDSDRSLLTRTFEALLGLPDGFLDVDVESNASLSNSSLELLRRLNDEFTKRDWPDELHRELVTKGLVPAVAGVGRPAGDDEIPNLPAWALPVVEARTARRIEAIEASGVNVVGDLARLRLPVDYRAAEEVALAAPSSISIEAAAAAVAGVVEAAAAMRARPRKAGRAKRAPADPEPRPEPGPGETTQPDQPGVRALGGRVLRRAGRGKH
jgi:hypothetical protein